MVGIVIVNYNGAKFQNECISSILHSSYQDFKIIIVDNGSTDNSMRLLDNFNDNRIIKIYNNDNLGVAKANNIGIKKSIELNCEYSLILNNDTVLEHETIQKLVDKNVDVASSKIYYFNSNKIWFFGGKISYLKGISIHYYKGKEKYKIKEKTKYAPTCCLMVRNNIFDMVGFFNENFFLYFDDTEFIYRLNKHNIPINLVNDSIVYHKVSMSSGGELSNVAIYYITRNRFYFIKKLPCTIRPIPYLYTLITRYIRMKKYPIIKKALNDYKKGIIGRCDDL